MDEFPTHQPSSGGCLLKLIVFVFAIGLLGIPLLGIVTGIVFVHGVFAM